MGVSRAGLAWALAALLWLGAPSYASGAHRSADAGRTGQAAGARHGLAATAHPLQGHRVRISGRTHDRTRTVTILRATRSGWRSVGTARVRHHRFRHQLRQIRAAATYRVASAHGRSTPLRVRLAETRTATTGTATTRTAPSSATEPKPRTPASDACGRRPTKPDGSLWSCTFDDEFSGTSLDRTKWLPQTQFTSGTPDAFACYRDDPSNVAVSGGTLNLTVRRESTPQPCAALPGQSSPYTAGMVSTYHLFSQQYGRFEVRMKSPTYAGAGLQDDFWLWPDDRVASTAVWPAAGEIDVMEHYSQYAGLDVPFLHYGTDMGSQPGVNTAYTCSIVAGAFNTYTLTWSAARLEIDVDGRPCLVNTSGDVAFQKPYILALTQALGAGTNALDAATPLPATVQVDYVRVWS